MNRSRFASKYTAGLIGAAVIMGLACAPVAEVVATAGDSPRAGQAPASGSAPAAAKKEEKTLRRSIHVRVVGPDGKAIAGAKVHASIWTKEPFKANRDYVCDAQGEAVVQLPQTLSILRLWGSADRYVPIFAHWESEEIQADPNAIPAEFAIELPKGTVIGSLVKSEDGQPIAGARVEASVLVGMDEQRQRSCVSRWLAEGEDARITDAQGRWTLDNVPAGDQVEVLVRLSHPDYIADYRWGVMQKAAKVTTALLRQQTATIVMARGIKVTGTVTDPNGKPVAGAVVVWGDDSYAMDGSQEVRTDQRGTYRFPPLPPMPMTVTAIAPGWAPELKKITITEQNPPVDFQLQPGKTLRLRFVDDAGKPLPEVSVGIEGWRGGKSLYNHKHPNVLDTSIPVQADKSGVYQWSWAPADPVTYSFWKEGYRPVRAAWLAADGVEHQIKLSR
jgi:hypothetical protein